MPAYRLSDIVDGQMASRFGHPDLIEADLTEATEYLALLDAQLDDLVTGLDLIAEDPELNDLEAHDEMQFQLQIIASVRDRRQVEMDRAVAARERLAGGKRRAVGSFWDDLPF